MTTLYEGSRTFLSVRISELTLVKRAGIAANSKYIAILGLTRFNLQEVRIVAKPAILSSGPTGQHHPSYDLSTYR